MSIFSRLPTWRRALPWVLLVISVGFNIAFYLGQRWHERYFADAEPSIVERARLTPAQAAEFKQLRARVLDEMSGMGQESARRARILWDDLREAPVDHPQAERLMREMSERRLEAQIRVFKDVSRFLDTLPPDQRAETVETVRRRDPLTRSLLFGLGGLPRPPRQPAPSGTPPPPAGPVPQ